MSVFPLLLKKLNPVLPNLQEKPYGLAVAGLGVVANMSGIRGNGLNRKSGNPQILRTGKNLLERKNGLQDIGKKLRRVWSGFKAIGTEDLLLSPTPSSGGIIMEGQSPDF